MAKKNANVVDANDKELMKAARSGRGGQRGLKVHVEGGGAIFRRLLKYVFKRYGAHMIAVLVLIFISVLANVRGTLFIQTLIDNYITPMLTSGSKDFGPLLRAILMVACFYAIGVTASYIQNKLMIYVSQGTLRDLREELFLHMETLPIRYFDRNTRGDIMSIYTNDIDTLRQMISQSMPQFFNSLITIVSVVISMFTLSIPLTLITFLMSGFMLFATGRLAQASGKNFIAQQKNLGALNGYIEEMMQGQGGDDREVRRAQRNALREREQGERICVDPHARQRPDRKCQLRDLRDRRRHFRHQWLRGTYGRKARLLPYI